ncbi:tetratricopeptide repeat protein [Myxococcus sp. CA040A]|uniref:tetratricopeptide repeat protein n=1 Tax=Myxococcus sp. CA040A TaxID=2741738 RepID=UPI00157B5123|nr:tetratricopeptide repeat protein [Myxococcus sp. CA040A]NTX01630.1 tetratricopeptide repeat protein [Myxococcus sp. CA040A]
MRSESRRLLLTCALLVWGTASAAPLVGPSVGNADALVAEGTKLYNKRKYAEASRVFLQATRANPSLLPAYLGLGRARMGAKETAGACAAYRAWLKSAPDIQERPKAKGELELCERQLKAARKKKKKGPVPADMTARHVELKADFFEALEAGTLAGPAGAGEQLRTLVTADYLGVDLAEMGTRLSTASRASAEDVHQRALKGEALTTEQLRTGRELLDWAKDSGEAAPQAPAQGLFLEGLVALQGNDSKSAEGLFAKAASAAPGVTEYRVWRAAALQRAGDLRGALAVMEAELPEDPRTDLLRAAVAQRTSKEDGARELERLLFQRYAAPPSR